MSKKIRSLRTPLAEVRGLGSAKHGSGHWWMQRLTSLALIPLSIYVLATFFNDVISGGYTGAIHWLSNPVTVVVVILFLGFGFHHAVSGLQVVTEDYVHCDVAKLASILTIKFIAVVLALLGSIAAIKILFFYIIDVMIQNAHK